MQQQKAEVKEFDACKCGETETLIGRWRNQIEEKGLTLDGFPTCLGIIDPVMQREGIPTLLGQKTFAGQVQFDMCMGCGSLRVIKLTMGEAISLPAPTENLITNPRNQ